MQRLRFIEDLKLSVAIDLHRFCPGGSHTTVFCLVQVPEHRNENEKLTHSARTLAQIKPLLPEYHTRQMRKNFKSKFFNLASVSPSTVDFIYKELTLDKSVAEHPDTQNRLRLTFLGELGSLADLRKLNPEDQLTLSILFLTL